MEEKLFLFFPIDPDTGNVVYEDPQTKAIISTPISSIVNFDASGAPGGWMQVSLSFERNVKYWSLFRSYSDPLLFTKRQASVMRNKFYSGALSQAKLDLLILKYNSQPQAGEGTYGFYYRGSIDFLNAIDTPDTGFQVNLIDAGLPQLLKAFENTKFAFPCDGSIPQNKKIILDGMLLQDTLNYNILNVQASSNGGFFVNYGSIQPGLPYSLPLFYSGNSGDNIGIITGNPGFALLDTQDAVVASSDYMFESANAITVKISGNIDIATPIPFDYPFEQFSLWLRTSNGQQVNLVPNAPTPGDFYAPFIKVTAAMSLSFSGTITLAANEKLFLLFMQFPQANLTIEGGSLQLDINSQYEETRAWGITAWDLWQLIVARIVAASNTNNLPFYFKAESTLLQNALNIMLSPGDAIRASGDPNYQKFFQTYQINAANPGSNVITTFGPVLKTTLYDFFQFCNVVLFAALGNQQLAGDSQSLFIETMNYVLNKNGNQFDIGEVAKPKLSFATELAYTEIEIGYPKQNYDQKAGKYEWNTTATWYTPFKNMPSKKLSLICPYRADAYGIERLRANLDDKSSTQNDGDNDIFIINADRLKSSYDFQTQLFNSVVRDIRNSANTNIKFLPRTYYQPITTVQTNGSYFEVNNDPSIFVFSYPGLSASKPIKFAYTGTFQGNPYNALTQDEADTITIKFFINGVAVYKKTWPSTGAQINIVDTFSLTRTFLEGDCVYATATTSVTGTAQILSSIDVDTSGTYWHADSSIPVQINGGSPNAMLAMPNIVANLVSNLAVVSFGFQYFLFNNILVNSTFKVSLDLIAALDDQNGGQTLSFHLYKNGVIINTQVFAAVNGQYLTPESSQTINPFDDMELGDIYFILASVQNVNAQLAYINLTWTSLTIQAFNLKRVQYDSLQGIPNIAVDQREGSATLGQIRTDVAGAPYNIEDLTPRRLLEKWSAFFSSIWFGQLTASLQFGTLIKNQYLSTTYQGKMYKENGPTYNIGAMNPALFIPLKMESEVESPINFSDLLTEVPNAHINSTFNGAKIGSFPWAVKQQPALNEKQKWTTMLSTASNLEDFIDLNISGLNYLIMAANAIYPGFTNSLQFVPQVQNPDARYQTADFNSTLFENQIAAWVNQNPYYNPWQIGEEIPLQFITNGLTGVIATVYELGTNKQIGDPITFTLKSSNAIRSPLNLYEGVIDLTGFTAGVYYVVVNAGGSVGSYIVSEPINVQALWERTIRFDYSNTYNRQTMIFDTGFAGAIRVMGFIDNEMQPKYVAADYIDQTQDITKLGFIPYETRQLWIGGMDGVPDYVIKKISRILGLDTVTIDGVAYSLDEGAEWEKTFWKGNPKKYWKTTIRPAKNIDAIAVTATGALQDTSVIISLDANLFGPNNGNNSTAEPVITNVEITD